MVIGAIVGGVACAATLWIAKRNGQGQSQQVIAGAQRKANSIVEAARRKENAKRSSMESDVREKSLVKRAKAETSMERRRMKLASREAELASRKLTVDEWHKDLDQKQKEIDRRFSHMKRERGEARAAIEEVSSHKEELKKRLSARSGADPEVVKSDLVMRWLEDERANAAQKIRAAEQLLSDPNLDRKAARLMNIASSRYQNHFLRERNRATLRVEPRVVDFLGKDDLAALYIFEEVANIKLHLGENGDTVRMEGLDGVGREVARRAITRISKRRQVQRDCEKDVRAFMEDIKTKVGREITQLGNKAFKVLEVEKAHPEIVELVGALNYRTSYTQNQWLHAVESAFFAGMIASEMDLDIKLARRAGLMHDIGKALTHKIEGSHAVIGADIARRLGEDELVANAIGAHHADEPSNSVYAYLVAATDAMSGARPGARRQQEDGFNTRVQDLEQIASARKGVDRAHAVHGGREIRVFVQPKVSDAEVVELSEDLAHQVSEELTFPGQVKVTVIREFEAVSKAS